MKKSNLRLFISFILISMNSLGQAALDESILSDSMRISYSLEIGELLKNRDYTAKLLGQTEVSPRNKILQDKFLKAIKENQDWYLSQQRKNLESGIKEFSYDPKLGLTKEEWNEYKNFLTSIQVEPIGYEPLIVTTEDKVILFHTNNELSIFNSISIDLIKNCVWVGDITLTFLDKINVKNENNGFRSSWNGFKWQFVNPNNLKMPKDQNELSKFSMQLYTFILGRIHKSGDIYLDISISEIENGKRKKNILLPILLN